MQIFPQEYTDGIDELIKVKASVSYDVPILDTDITMGNFHKQVLSLGKVLRTTDRLDLHPLYSVLVTIAWNKNDDIFTKEEVWPARNSPQDKPFNLMHNQLDIIGHITDNFVVDALFNKISDSTSENELPNKFHIITAAVIYKYWEDEKRQEQMNRILAEIADNKWYVSMECLFKGFNYGILSANGQSRIIPRNSETAGLTRFLRAYGGPGVYNGHKIGRVLKEITFSGKGLVNNPANPESIILDNFDSTQADLGYLNNVQNISLRGGDMADSVAELKAEVADLKSKLEDQKSNADLHRIHVLENEIEALKKGRDAHDSEMRKHMTEKECLTQSCNEEVGKMTAEVEKYKTIAEEKDKKMKEKEEKEEALLKEIETLKAETEYQKKELEEFKKAGKKRDRETAFQKAGVDPEFLDSLVETSTSMTDEEFEKFVKTVGDIYTTRPRGTGKEDDKKDKKEDKKEDKEKASEVDSKEIVDTAVSSVSSNLGVLTTNDDFDKTAQAIADFYKSYKGEK